MFYHFIARTSSKKLDNNNKELRQQQWHHNKWSSLQRVALFCLFTSHSGTPPSRPFPCLCVFVCVCCVYVCASCLMRTFEQFQRVAAAVCLPHSQNASVSVCGACQNWLNVSGFHLATRQLCEAAKNPNPRDRNPQIRSFAGFRRTRPGPKVSSLSV